jgi:hypothetical protein
VSADSITPALKQFISRHIRSVQQVEILCLFNGDPAKTWTLAQVLRTTQSTEKSVADCLEAFCKEGFLVSEQAGTFRFSPKTPELNQAVSELATAYRERLAAIVETIYSKPRVTRQASPG